MRYFIFLMTVLLGLPSIAKDMMDMRVYGKEAPTKMYLFTSLVCPHCAEFHREILPAIQEKYLKTNKTQLVVVDMLMNKPNLMGAMLLRCAPEDKTNQMEDALYSDQPAWALDENKARAYLAEAASRGGISAGEFENCLSNTELAKTIVTEQERMSRLYDVKRMPTLMVRQGEKTSSWEGADKETILNGLSEFFK